MTMPFLDPRLALMMRGAQQPSPAQTGLMAAAQPQAQNPNIWDRAFGVPGSTGLLDPQALKAARRQGLLQAGIAMLANADRPFGQALQAGLQGGQQGYQGQMAGAQQTQQQAALNDIQQKYAGKNDLQSRLAMFNDLARAGLTEPARAVATVIQAEMAMQGRGGRAERTQITKREIDGKQMFQVKNLDTGAWVGDPWPVGTDATASEKAPTSRQYVRPDGSIGYEEWHDGQWVKTDTLAAGTAQFSAPERMAGLLLPMANRAYETLQKVWTSPNRIQQIIGKKGWNEITDEDRQLLYTAGFAMLDAYIRPISGAAVPDTEVDRFVKTYLPGPGDTEATLNLKRDMLAEFMGGLRRSAGKYNKFYGPKSDADVAGGLR
jgi:hypothetical protein